MFGKPRRIPTYNLQPKPISHNRNLEFAKRRGASILTKLKKLFTLSFIIGVIGLIVYILFFSSFFNIKETVIINRNFENQAISDQVQSALKTNIGKNIFAIKTTNLENKILNTFPELEKIKISKSFPHNLNIQFSEFPMVANIVNESNVVKKSYIINATGFAIKENLEDPHLPYIRVKTDEPINPKEAVIEKSKLNYILDAKNYYEDKFGMKIKEILYKPIAREVRLRTERDFSIWLDIQKSFEEQFKKLKKAIVKLDIYKENFEYIDLRIAGSSGDKIVYQRRR
ncbi:FtsQ-type POTRA domain-containing protein [Candidatus Peregrinibacteria bacterium]|nr:FtsQ-type POTRA domain-containing protein [Candidatus Peregrinibacteria bacterium]